MKKKIKKYKKMLYHEGIAYTAHDIGKEFYKRLAAAVYKLKIHKFVKENRYKKFADELYKNSLVKSRFYKEYQAHEIKITAEDIKPICFYLPQFHPIPENDRWWGKGFTEWTNVTKALPQFLGHYQPHLPGELGFYDLRVPEIQKRQIELAKNYGIYGFCYYYYWFNGKRVLEMPLDRFIKDKKLDFPFCICWANENWTKKWDGRENDILLKQSHSKNDDINFIKSLLAVITDKRYIRIDGKPLIIVYRPSLLPDAKETALRWRAYCRRSGAGEIYLAYTTSFDKEPPQKFGFDAAIEFPPINSGLVAMKDNFTRLNNKFAGTIYDYNELVEGSKSFKKTDYDFFRGITPSWDNSARNASRGTILWNADPVNYKKWLNIICEYTANNFRAPKRFIFINAWNEWAEGTHLEPDQKYGHAWLQATCDALLESRKKHIDSHDAASPVNNNSTKELLVIGKKKASALLNRGKRNILFDLFFCQPGYHGGGEYGKAVFKALAETIYSDGKKSEACELCAALNRDLFIDQWVLDACSKYNIKIINVRSYDDIIALVNQDSFDVFFTPAIVVYTGHEYMKIIGKKIKFRQNRTRVIGTLHDIRDYEIASDFGAFIRHWGNINCYSATYKNERTIRKELRRKSAEAKKLKAMYEHIVHSNRIDALITDTDYTKKTIIKKIGAAEDRIKVFFAPMKERSAPDKKSIAINCKKYALLMNADRIEKNIPAAIRAFDELFDRNTAGGLKDLQVAVTGIPDIDALGMEIKNKHRFIVFGYLQPEELEYLYSNAFMLVYASLNEGFGYPPIEIMKYNRPSVVAANTSLPEICKNSAVYCDPYSVNSIKQAIIKMASNPIKTSVLKNHYKYITDRQKKDLRLLIEFILERAEQVPGKMK